MPITLRHCQVMPGNAGNTKGNTGDANNLMPLPSHAGKTLGTLRETLGTPITLRHCQVTLRNAGNAKGNTEDANNATPLPSHARNAKETLGTPITLCYCQVMPGTLRETLGTPITLYHCQVMPGNAKGNTGNANDATPLPSHARKHWER